MPSFFKIISTTALCIAAVGLSSCVTTVHRYVWNRAKIVDKAYWVENEDDIELYRVGNAVYAKGYIGPARGGQTTDDIPAIILISHGGAGRCFNPIKEKGQPVYIRVSGSYSDLRKKLEKNRQTKPDENKIYVSWNSAEEWPCLTKLPADAVRLSERGRGYNDIGWWRGDKARNDSHQYYAYPLGALIAVTVDLPLSIAGNTLLIGSLAATIPCAGVHAVYLSCTQNGSTAEPSEKPKSQSAHEDN